MRAGASKLWPPYDPHPHTGPINPRLRLVRSEEPLPYTDPACDYIEGAKWWIVRSVKSVQGLQRAFANQDMACRLYETIGAFFEMGRLPNRHHLMRMQIVDAGDWATDLSLSDAGIYVEEPYTGADQ